MALCGAIALGWYNYARFDIPAGVRDDLPVIPNCPRSSSQHIEFNPGAVLPAAEEITVSNATPRQEPAILSSGAGQSSAGPAGSASLDRGDDRAFSRGSVRRAGLFHALTAPQPNGFEWIAGRGLEVAALCDVLVRRVDIFQSCALLGGFWDDTLWTLPRF